MNRLLTLFAGILLLLAHAGTIHAMTVVARDFNQLVMRADTIFKGTVAAKKSEWTGKDSSRHIVTLVTFQVEETYKGAPTIEQTLRFLGGTVDTTTLEVPEMPQFEVGQRAVLFVVGNGRQFCPLVGVAQGRFYVVKDQATGRERIFTDDHSPMADTAEIGKLDAAGVPLLKRHVQSSAQAMSVEDFRSEILAKVATLTR